ncbi:ABC transporter permease [Acidocella sp. KAb 2-4]|uniref:ABC transporter permease n=1 Tax=Acidocella sp. KAb 2-4 TaxID=2885158 RepID=UPI001D093484|nr:ABC transporter permease [Acidocella sp. KAb 2-4]MCB5944546.1 ABC transporter permease [Acidocella sp. KAb 2-4]
MIPRGVRYALSGISWPVYALLYTPLALVAYYSFSPAPNQTGHSLYAYGQLMHDAAVFTALRRSLILALGSAATSTALGTLLGYGLCRFRARNATGVLANIPSLIIYTPIIMPSLVFGISELIFFNFVHSATGFLGAGLQTMIIAHITFQVPYVALTVYARLAGLDPYLFDAAQDLYADGIKSFLYLIIPVVQPAIIGGFLLGITLSIDDFTISFFTAGPGSVTLPIYIYSAIARKGITPEVNAIGTLMIGTIVVLALVHFFITRHRERAGQFAARGNIA